MRALVSCSLSRSLSLSRPQCVGEREARLITSRALHLSRSPRPLSHLTNATRACMHARAYMHAYASERSERRARFSDFIVSGALRRRAIKRVPLELFLPLLPNAFSPLSASFLSFASNFLTNASPRCICLVLPRVIVCLKIIPFSNCKM